MARAPKKPVEPKKPKPIAFAPLNPEDMTSRRIGEEMNYSVPRRLTNGDVVRALRALNALFITDGVDVHKTHERMGRAIDEAADRLCPQPSAGHAPQGA